MYYKLISSNISKLDSSITYNFFKNNNINISEDESLFLTELAKKYWEDLYNKNYYNVFNIMSKKMDIKTCNDIKNLYLKVVKQYLNWYCFYFTLFLNSFNLIFSISSLYGAFFSTYGVSSILGILSNLLLYIIFINVSNPIVP